MVLMEIETLLKGAFDALDEGKTGSITFRSIAYGKMGPKLKERLSDEAMWVMQRKIQQAKWTKKCGTHFSAESWNGSSKPPLSSRNLWSIACKVSIRVHSQQNACG